MQYNERKNAYLQAQADAALSHSSGSELADGIFHLLPLEAFRLTALLETGRGPTSPFLLEKALARINERRDCADFVLVALLRILLRPAATRLGEADRKAIIDAALHFCYWYDQRDASGRGIQGMCFHTENHQILFHTAEILAGQLLPDHRFVGTQQTGAWHKAQGTQRALAWLEQRRRFGFAEWLSCYFDEDLLALVSLSDFAQETPLRKEARKTVDFLLSEVARHSHHGVVGTSQGRTYAEFLKGRRQDPLGALTFLLFGQGNPDLAHPTFAAIALATSDYTCPETIVALAQAAPLSEGIEIHARYGIGPEEAETAGIDLDSVPESLLFWSVQNARHPRLRPTAYRLAATTEDTWLTNFIAEMEGITDGNDINTCLGPVDIQTFRTPSYQLSCAQDFRPGGPGYQQHIWQATIDTDAVVFTNQPGGWSESSAHSERPNFWAGNRSLPRAVQHRNVLICLHRCSSDALLPFSHAYFPRAAFDEVRETQNWVLARKGDAYLALYSQHPADWYGERELRTKSCENVWICEMSDTDQSHDFDHFCQAIISTEVICDRLLSVRYQSPNLGTVRFGWTEGFTIDGQEITLHPYPRPTGIL